MPERKKIVITGAASGIGRATAQRFASEGYDVCLNDIQELEAVLGSLPAGKHLQVQGSFADEATITQIAAHVAQEWGRIDVLVNCAGFGRPTPVADTSVEDWESVFHILSRGAVLTSRLALALMKSGGRLIHITSIHGERAEFGSGSYAMAKAAINQYCRTLAVEFAGHNILVNAIAPGFVNTAMSLLPDGTSELETDWFRDNYVTGNHLPLRRAAEPEEIAGVAFFLAGKDASYITGQVLTVDGGLSITF